MIYKVGLGDLTSDLQYFFGVTVPNLAVDTTQTIIFPISSPAIPVIASEIGTGAGMAISSAGSNIGLSAENLVSNAASQINPFGNNPNASSPTSWLGIALLIGGGLLAFKVFAR